MVPGSRISLDDLVAAFKRGKTPEAIHDAFETVSLADVYAILTYYLRHRPEVEKYLEQQIQEDARVRADIEAAFPGTTTGARVDRARLAERLVGDDDAFRRLEAIVHPAVRRAEADFIARSRAIGAPAVVLDIPLLFETGRQGDVDKTVVVSAPAETQRARVLSRPGMTEEKFEALLARQMPDAEKRARADFVIPSGDGIAAAKASVRAFLRQLLP